MQHRLFEFAQLGLGYENTTLNLTFISRSFTLVFKYYL